MESVGKDSDSDHSRGKPVMSEKSVHYVPIGADEEIELTIDYIKRFLVHPTKSGKMPDFPDLVRFMMLCKTQQLNPWVGDAFLVGYDQGDDAVFNLITSASAFLKRAELNDAFDGIESGVIVQDKLSPESEPRFRDGNFYCESEVVVGGWSRVHRKDRRVPFFTTLRLSTYSSGKSRWAKDGPGMIEKVARVQGLRTAFPNQLSGVYCREEGATIEGSVATEKQSTVDTKTSKVVLISEVPETNIFMELLKAVGAATAEKAEGIRADIHLSSDLSDDQKDSLLAMIDRKFSVLSA